MKNVQKLSVILCLLFVTALAVFTAHRNRQAFSVAAATQTSKLEYAFSSNGIMLGAEPSPLQFVQATRNGVNVPVNGSFQADLDLLSNVALQVKNTSDVDIKLAKLIVSFIDVRSNRIVAQLCGAPLKGVPAGAEQTVKAVSNNSEKFRQTVAELGGAVRVLVRVDLVELANATSWKYGLIHRQDPNDPNQWVPVAANRIGQVKGRFSTQPATFHPGGTLFGCGFFHGYQSTPHYCEYCQCDLYDENWNSTDNGIGPAEYGDVPTGCNGHTPAECDPCTKVSFISPSC